MNIYFDNNATAPTHPAVIEAMTRVWQEGLANPASQHAPGRTARRILEHAREAITALLGGKISGMDADTLLFTSGGTEANNLALFGLSAEKPGPIVISPLEHPSITSAAAELVRRGAEVRRLRANNAGCVDLDSARDLITPEVRLVSVMLANNETGVIQPLPELAALCRERGVLLHTDAAQAIGKIPVDFRRLDVAAMTIAPHKFHGPVGIGGLLVRHGVTLQPQLFGGFQQAGLRPGTEPVALAVGFQTALEIWEREASTRTEHLARLRDELQALLTAGDPSAVVIGGESHRLPHTLNIAFPNVDRQALVMALDLAGVACSTGSACASGSSELSPTLLAMGIPECHAAAAIRFSLGILTTAAEVSLGADRILRAIKQLRRP